MRFVTPQEAAYLLQLVLLYLEVHRSESQQYESNMDINNNQYMEQNIEYQNYEGETKDDALMCYMCTYHVRKGNAAGHENCRDPFIKTDIAQVPCTGTCAKIYHKISDTEYTITRTCLPNCKDVADDKGYTECCAGDLCNGGAATTTVSCLLFSSSLAASTWYTLR